jgi:arsenate reductase
MVNADPKRSILLLCTGNSCRSQMAEGFLRAALGDLAEVHSAGSNPSGEVNPLTIQVMAEVGIDISSHRSKHLNEFLDKPITAVITLCGSADQACPVFPGQVSRHHWPFLDPGQVKGTQAELLKCFRTVRDEIRRVMDAYAAGLRDARNPASSKGF